MESNLELLKKSLLHNNPNLFIGAGFSLGANNNTIPNGAVIHFQLPFAVRLEVPYLIGSRLVIAATHQSAAYLGGFPDFQPFGYWQRFDAERVRLLNIQVVITGGDKYEGGHDVAAHDDFIHYILHIHYYIAVS